MVKSRDAKVRYLIKFHEGYKNLCDSELIMAVVATANKFLVFAAGKVATAT